MKIVINKCYGGFGLSLKAVMQYAKLKGFRLYAYIDDIAKRVYKEKAVLGNPSILKHYSKKVVKSKRAEDIKSKDYFSERDIERNDPILVQVIKELGREANGECAELEIVEIPDGVEWEIGEYDGMEWVAEKHRTWH